MYTHVQPGLGRAPVAAIMGTPIDVCVSAVFADVNRDLQSQLVSKLRVEWIFSEEDLRRFTVSELHEKVKIPLAAAKRLEERNLLKSPEGAAPAGGHHLASRTLKPASSEQEAKVEPELIFSAWGRHKEVPHMPQLPQRVPHVQQLPQRVPHLPPLSQRVPHLPQLPQLPQRDESMVFDTPPFNEDTQYRAPQGLAARRVYKVGKWTPSETLILVQCKQMNREKYSLGGNKRTLMTSAIERYSAMEEEMVKRGVMRSKNQIQEKWEQLGADFKKVYDYEKHIPSGRPSYFQMSPQERKQSTRRKFPKAALDEGVFKALCEWFPIKLQSLESDNLPIESSTMPSSSVVQGYEARTIEDSGDGEFSTDSSKKQRLSEKASVRAISTMENSRTEIVEAIVGGEDREDERHRVSVALENDRLSREDVRHQEALQLEKERLLHTNNLGRGYISALMTIGEELKTIGEELKRSES